VTKRFLAIEGLDGAGKSTQTKLLKSYFTENSLEYRYLHFPRTNVPPYGEMIARFLRGEFGKVESVDPYLVALLYALDRSKSKSQINEWLSKGYWVLVDRYVYSNLAFQCAKLKNHEDKERLREWIMKLEYKHNRIPKPDISILLNVPFNFVSKSLSDKRHGDSREYLNGKEDIHENSLSLQSSVHNEYNFLINKYEDFFFIDCNSEDGDILEPEVINENILKLISEKMGLEP
jgi:dTMP kinase